MTLSDRTLRLQLETVTLAFAAGATPRRIDPYMPVRPSAVRGALRQWFRAAAAAVLPRPDAEQPKVLPEELARLEAGVFGDTTRASSVAVLPPSFHAPEKGLLEDFPLGGPDRVQWAGLRYLGYGLFEDKTRGPQAIRERQRFELRLALRGGDGREQAGLRELLSATLWLWLNLGALGARGRRGFGAIRCCHDQRAGLEWPEHLCRPPADHRALGRYLAEGKTWAWGVFYRHLPTNFDKRSPDARDDKAADLPLRTLAGIETFTALPHEFDEPCDALNFVGRLFRDYRSTLERGRRGEQPLPDYTSVKAAIQSGRPPNSVDRAAFGLPLPFYFRSLGGMSTRFVPTRAKGERYDRLASPLCIRVCPVGDDQSPRYVPVLYNWAETRGARPLLDCKVRDTRSDGLVAQTPDGAIIANFIDWARRQPHKGAGGGPAPRGR
ncbi:MAG: type III-B CRISPR module RAMP protein Cmr1 [Polyangiaceae bacterium]|nr:type III-B CRISPR module RAMP protein Cmr1 [Polyangiaceae bacterium]